jgi:hypothetical protein
MMARTALIATAVLVLLGAQAEPAVAAGRIRAALGKMKPRISKKAFKAALKFHSLRFGWGTQKELAGHLRRDYDVAKKFKGARVPRGFKWVGRGVGLLVAGFSFLAAKFGGEPAAAALLAAASLLPFVGGQFAAFRETRALDASRIQALEWTIDFARRSHAEQWPMLPYSRDIDVLSALKQQFSEL